MRFSFIVSRRLESQEALVFSDNETSFWGSTANSMLPVVDVFHRDDRPPVFTAAGRIVEKANQGNLESFGLRHQGEKKTRKRHERNLMDGLFQTVFNLMLPLMVASAFGDDAKSPKDKSRHHKYHHHRRHHKHIDSQPTHAEHENQQKNELQSPVASSLRRSTVAPASGDSKVELSSSSSGALKETSELEKGGTTQSAGAAWPLLSALAVMVCVAIVVVWRTLLVRKLKKKGRWRSEDTQLMERPHLH